MQQLIRPFLRLFLLLAAFLLSILLLPVAAASPTFNVTLVYFRGQGLDNAARLEWRTASEDGTAAYKIERGDSEDGPFEYLSDIGIIEARGSLSYGDTYDATDNTAQNGQTYWYRLIEIEFDNSERVLHTTRVEIAPPPTPEPIEGGTDQQESTPVPTSTSAATNTPASGSNGDNDNNGNSGTNASGTPTATGSSNQVTNTPAPSATRGNRPTNTPPPPPTRMTFNSGNTAEAAGLNEEAEVVAQITPGVDSYPGPNDDGGGTGSEETYPAPPPENDNGVAADPANSYPPGAGGGNAGNVSNSDSSAVGSGRAVGSGSSSVEGQEQETQQGGSGARSRLLLWAGFIVSLLVFIGGAAFAIMLSTRQRHNNP